MRACLAVPALQHAHALRSTPFVQTPSAAMPAARARSPDAALLSSSLAVPGRHDTGENRLAVLQEYRAEVGKR